MSRKTLRLLLCTCLMAMLFPTTLISVVHAAEEDCDQVPSDPAAVGTGLTDMGFESGDLAPHWRIGATVNAANAPTVTTADSFTSPFEGQYMARIGQAAASSSVNQPPGPNELCQDFVVDEEQETFVYNVFTWDYQGFDDFRFDLRVTDPATGQILGAYQQGAWGSGTDLKTTGWTGITLDLSGHVGETVRLTFSAGGTADSLYSLWAYLDSGDLGAPPLLAPIASVETDSGSVMTDPQTGQVTIGMPWGTTSDVTVVTEIECPEGQTPSNVVMLFNGGQYAMTPGTGTTYSATIPADAITASGTISIEVTCDGTKYVAVIGKIQLYDPSGIVTDAVTGQPVVGATVTLYKATGWLPKQFPGDTTPMTCESNLSKPAGQPWSQPAATADGVEASPFSGEIDPQVNPFITNNVGYYGWDVAEGCWYVVVEKDGYVTLTSPMVGVPPEVTDLDLQLTPLQVDTTAPSCSVTLHPGPPAFIQVALSDTESGLAAVQVTKATNVTVDVPVFTTGTTDTVVVTATKINNSKKAQLELTVTDAAGNAVVCDPVHVLEVRQTGRPVTSVLDEIPEEEGTVTVMNGDPGLQRLDVEVNGTTWKLTGLRKGEERTIDVSAVMRPGTDNSVRLTAYGKPGGSADVWIWDGVE